MTVRTEILIIGNEILSGHTLDTNSQWLAQRLLELDISVNQIQVIEDRVDLIAKTIKESLARHTNLLFTSGGLGPTHDDLTAQGVALALEKPLRLHPTALKMVTSRYRELKAQELVLSEEITPARKKMAYLPIGAEPLPNNVGSAPGIKIQLENTWIYCLPELYSIFLETIAPQIALLTNKTILQEIIQVPLLDESTLAPILDSIIRETQGVHLKSLPQPYQKRQPLRVAIISTAETKTQARLLLNQAIEKLQERTDK